MPKRRANGEGNIRKRKDGRWEGRYTAGYDPETGKRIIKNVLGKTQAEVKEKLKAAISESQRLDVSKVGTSTVASWVSRNSSGRTDMRSMMTPETILVSIMHTNNEIGALQPIEEAGALIKQMNPDTLFHVDAVQGFGKSRIYPKKMHIDLLSVSGHKIHGPKGVGLLYVGDKVKIQPIVFGGGQQQNLRSGTENVPGIAGLAKAAEMLYSRFDEDHARLCACKRRFIEGVRELDQVTVNGLLPDAPYGEGTAAHIVSVSFAGVRSEVLLHALEDKGIYVSAGSACSAHKPQPSATLKAIGIDKSLLDSTIRFSFSVFTTEEEIDVCLQALYNIVPMLRRYSRR